MRALVLVAFLPLLAANPPACGAGLVPGLKANLPDSPSEMVKAGSDLQKVGAEQREAQKKCDALKTQPVAYEEEVQIGGAVAMAWVSKNQGLWVDSPVGGELPANEKTELNRYVNQVGRNVAALSSRPTLEWTFGVLASESVNAYSSPGGYVFVTKGLLKKMTNEAQLAGALAHEIAHVTQKHALKSYSEVKANQCGIAAKGSAVGGIASAFQIRPSLGGEADKVAGFLDVKGLAGKAVKELTDKIVDNITSQGFAKDDEFEADQVALELMTNAGYQPKEYISFLGKLPDAEGVWAKHPKNAERQAKLEKQLADHANAFGFTDSANLPAVALGPEMKSISGSAVPASGKK